MNYYDFLKSVRERTVFPEGHADVEATIRAVLEVLGRRISSGQADDLAALLPIEMRSALRQGRDAESFGLQDFVARVAEREGVSAATALNHARAVLSLLAESIPQVELQDTLDQLPKEMRELFSGMRKAA